MSSHVLNTFPSQDGSSRLVLASETDEVGNTQLVLRQETLSDHVGWFVQSRIRIEPDQVAALKMTLTSRLVDESSQPSLESRSILPFDAAAMAS